MGHVHAPLQDQHDEAEDVPDEVDILVVDRRVGSCRQGAAVDAEQVDQNGQVGGVQFLWQEADDYLEAGLGEYDQECVEH